MEKNLSNEVKKPVHKKRGLKSIALQALGIGALAGITYGVWSGYHETGNSPLVDGSFMGALYGTVNFAVFGISEVISRAKDYNIITKN